MSSSRILTTLWRKAVDGFEALCQDAEGSNRLPNKEELLEHQETVQDLLDIFVATQDANSQVASQGCHSLPVSRVSNSSDGAGSSSAQLKRKGDALSNTSKVKRARITSPSSRKDESPPANSIPQKQHTIDKTATKKDSGSDTSFIESDERKSDLSAEWENNSEPCFDSERIQIPARAPVISRKSDFTYAHDQQLWRLYRAAGGAYPSDRQFAAVYAKMPYSRQTVRNRMSRLIALHREVDWGKVPLPAFNKDDHLYMQSYFEQKRSTGVPTKDIVQTLAAQLLTTHQRVHCFLLSKFPGQIEESSADVAAADLREPAATGGGGIDGTNDNGGSESISDSATDTDSDDSDDRSNSDDHESNSSNGAVAAASQSNRKRYYTPEEDELILKVYFATRKGQRGKYRKLARQLHRTPKALEDRIRTMKRLPRYFDRFASTVNSGNPTMHVQPQLPSVGKASPRRQLKSAQRRRTAYTAEEDQRILSIYKHIKHGERAHYFRKLGEQIGRSFVSVQGRLATLRVQRVNQENQEQVKRSRALVSRIANEIADINGSSSVSGSVSGRRTYSGSGSGDGTGSVNISDIIVDSDESSASDSD